MSKVDKGRATKVLSQSFVDNHAEINEDEAANLIVKSSQLIKQLADEMKNDDKLNAAKQIVADFRAGYTSAIKHEKAKIDFLLGKIEEIQTGEVNPSSGANS